MTLEIRIVGAHFDLFRVLVRNLDMRCGNILRHIDHDGAGTTAGGNIKCLLQGLRQFIQILDQEVMFDTGSGYSHRVDFLKCIAADCMAWNLAGYNNHRNRIHVGGRDPGNRVRRAGARSYQANARLAGCPCIAIRGMGSALLVAHQDMLYVVLFLQCIVDMQDGTTRVAKQVLDPFVFQELDYYFGTR